MLELCMIEPNFYESLRITLRKIYQGLFLAYDDIIQGSAHSPHP